MKQKILFLLLGLGLCCAPAQAEKNFTAADYLVETGEYELRMGRVEGAIKEFSRALKVDPEHKKAREYLARYGMDRGIYSQGSDYEGGVGQLARAVMHQKESLADLQMQKTQTDMELAKVKDVRDALSSDLTDKNLMIYDMKRDLSNLERRSKNFDKQVRQIEKVYQERQADLEMDLLFSDQKVELSAEQLGRIHAYEDELISLQEDYNKLREMTFMDKVKREAAYTAMTDYVLVHARVVDDLRDETLYKDMNIANHGQALMRKMDALDQSLEDIKHLRASVDMKDAMLQEKQKDIIRLKEELNKMNVGSEARLLKIRKTDPQLSALVSELERSREVY